MGEIDVAGSGGRLSRRSLLLAGGGLLLAGCGERERPTIDSSTDDSSAKSKLRAVLERRTKALADGDEKAYLADLDPSNKDLIARERMAFANLRQFEFDELKYVYARMGERTQNDGSTLLQPVIRITKLSADAGPGDLAPGESFSYRVADKGGRFVVTDIVPATRAAMDKLGFTGPEATAPWHTDKLHVVKASGNVWLAADDSVRDLNKFVDATGQEIDFVTKLWGDRPTFPGHVLFFTRDAANFKQWFDFGTADNFNPDVLGVQMAQYGVKKDGQYYENRFAGSRIVVNLGSIESADSSPRDTIRHELVHAISSRARLGGALQAPTWAVEGFARYSETIGKPGRASAVRAVVSNGVRGGKFRNKLPAEDDFYGRDVGYNYCLGATVFQLAERIEGREAATELYATAIDTIDAGGEFLNFPRFDSIAQRIFGMSGPGFRDRWLRFVRNGG
ncbi:hypothetical protein [Micromonospora globbae]|uniref:hypothetical protein n=1 Tax=Micromonospora globbae TaxID=1894969 RepID=UPI003432EBD2